MKSKTKLKYSIDSTRYIFKVMILVTQIDLAFISMILGEITTIVTIRLLLNEKEFKSLNNEEECVSFL